jgi:ribonucleotide monophosphatase NagD (HAD superfamily)
MHDLYFRVETLRCGDLDGFLAIALRAIAEIGSSLRHLPEAMRSQYVLTNPPHASEAVMWNRLRRLVMTTWQPFVSWLTPTAHALVMSLITGLWRQHERSRVDL